MVRSSASFLELRTPNLELIPIGTYGSMSKT